MLYQCGNTCSTPLGEEPALQDDPTLMSYMEWYGDSTMRLDPAGNVYRTVRQTGQNRLQEMLSISTENPYGQNEVEITGEFRQFDPLGGDVGHPNGHGWYIPTNGLLDGSGNLSFYKVKWHIYSRGVDAITAGSDKHH